MGFHVVCVYGWMCIRECMYVFIYTDISLGRNNNENKSAYRKP